MKRRGFIQLRLLMAQFGVFITALLGIVVMGVIIHQVTTQPPRQPSHTRGQMIYTCPYPPHLGGRTYREGCPLDDDTLMAPPKRPTFNPAKCFLVLMLEGMYLSLVPATPEEPP